MSDDSKTREELLEELQALRARIAELEGASSSVTTPEPPENEDPAGRLSRRHLIRWVTPVVLSSAALPKTLYAQGSGPPSPPTPAPTPSPTPSPTPGG